MICPQCKAEYRQGFTVCADCDVPLVDRLTESGEMASITAPSGPLVLLWEGDDLALHTTLLEELNAANIRHIDRPMGVYPGVRRWSIFPIQPMTRFGYEVAVFSSDLASGKRILEKLLEEKPDDMELPALDEQQDETPERAMRQQEAATCEIWSGSGEKLAEFLAAALKENGISARVEKQSSSAMIYTAPGVESRAREIVREIIESAPPE